MNRRELLKSGAACAAFGLLPGFAPAVAATFAPKPSGWRSFEITTTVTPSASGKAIRAWVPVAGFNADDWNRPEGNRWTTNAKQARLDRDPHSGAGMLYLEWDAGEAAPRAEIVSLVSTRDRASDMDASAKAVPLTRAERERYLAGTRLAPLDGIVRETSDRIVGDAGSDLEKARRIYDWVVASTYRRASTRGCGDGDIVAMLSSGDLGGKCADINPLFTALVRAAGIPARDLYGVRVAPSAFGYKSLGAKNEIVTSAQHCRAEIYLEGIGWIATDPADVRKVMLEEEKDGLAADDPRVAAVRQKLFGSWEGNWIAFNDGSDIALPSSQGPELGFLMYPQAEVASIRMDCLDADSFRYAMSVREITI
ncbi:transglutaminase-like putative cysteine protease [Ochrobactrum daejeonense]|uniref:Transglutaminase-like putative cysteine protease n=1 Tax=Brucella daejeonensis TaxID=659015 RepID=A0A7W9AX07_9HYPH|nr:transglutaminase-like domain-containing protein [Brucella daejeonensis]MBB5702170.1 transglutaminase-like putative cysteine protease [Brucella daejeonensis]